MILPHKEWCYWFSIVDQQKLNETSPACKKCGYWTVLDENGICKYCQREEKSYENLYDWLL